MNPEIKKMYIKIEKDLENWEIYHALREIIANALDEQFLTDTQDIDIFQDKKGNWHIKDFGRGIKPEDFTRKEDGETNSSPNLIGNLGAGLKNALAIFNRNNIKVVIKSRYGLYTIGKSAREHMKQVITLICIFASQNTSFLGTEFILTGISDKDMERARNLFLKYTKTFVMDNTPAGQILKKNTDQAAIYVRGVKVAEEANFLFSYNITLTDSNILKDLYREQPNIARNAYVDSIRNILVSSSNQKIAKALLKDLSYYEQGTNHDELRWLDVQVNAIKIVNSFSKVIFLTPEDQENFAEFMDKARQDGYDFIPIPSILKRRIQHTQDVTGAPIRNFEEFYKLYQKSFRFAFIEPKNLMPAERGIFEKTTVVFNLLGGKPHAVKQVKISEKMRKDIEGQKTVGLWDSNTGTIIIKRSQLASIEAYAGTLLHEISHAVSGAEDRSRSFEQKLTNLLGALASQLIQDPPTCPKANFLQKLTK